MKYKILLSLCALTLFSNANLPVAAHSGHAGVDHTLAQGATGSATNKPETTPEKTLLNDQIKALKDKIATKVAEISKSNKQIVTGTVQSTSEAGFTILSKGKSVKVLIDSEVVTYQNLIDENKKITLKSIKKGDYVVLDGVMLGSEFSVKTVYLQIQYELLNGTIKNVDARQYFVEVITSDQDTVTVDIEKSTVQRKIDPKTLDIVKAGFSDYTIGDRIQCVIPKRGADVVRASGVRTLIIPESALTQ